MERHGTQVDALTNISFNSVTYGNDVFVGVGSGGCIAASPMWHGINRITENTLQSIAYGNGQFIAVGDFGTILSSKADNSGVVFKTDNLLFGECKIKIRQMNNAIAIQFPLKLTFNKVSLDLLTMSGKRIPLIAGEIKMEC